jgi:hypothetical protein
MDNLPPAEGKFKPTEDEIAAMREIDSAFALGLNTAPVPNVPQRLYDHGIVTKADGERLTLTVKGKRALRASNMQG